MKKFHVGILLYIFSISLAYYYVSSSIKSNIEKEILSKSHISSITLDSFFTNIFNIMQDKGRKISKKGSKVKAADIKNILSRNFSYNILNTNIPTYTVWPEFFWINKEGKISVTSYGGVLKKKEDLVFKSSHFLSKTNNWEMFFSEPRKDSSGNNTIDLSVGVSDNNGDYLGIIVARLEIDKIFNLINNVIQEGNFEYIVYNNKKILLSPHDYFYSYKNNDLKQFLRNNNKKIINNGIVIGEDYFNKLDKLSNFPVYLVSGYNKKSLNITLVKNLFLHTFVISIIFYLILLAHHLYKRGANLKRKKLKFLIKRNKILSKKFYKELKQLSKSKKINDKFFIDLILRSNQHLNTIKYSIEVLLKSKINKNQLDTNSQLDIYGQILENINKIESLLPGGLERVKIDIIEAINISIKNNYDLRIKFNIDVNFSYQKDIKFIEVDELGFIQIMSALIYSAYMNRPNSKINVNLSIFLINGKEYINIIIIDDGIGLNEDDKKSFKIDNVHRHNLNNIKEIVSLYNGEVNFKSEYNVGTKVSVSIPVKMELKNNKTKDCQDKNCNVIQFPLNKDEFTRK